MRRLSLRFLLLIGIACIHVPTTHAAIIAGVESTGVPPTAPADGPRIERLCDVTINFDNVTAPCAFASTGPLRNEYSGQGVTFAGPDANGGGAILDQCSNFGVSGFSAPNFLAFNSGATMQNGGIPRTPETMTFSSPMSAVSILVGSADESSLVTLEAYNAGNALVDSDSVNLSANLQLLSVSGPGIVRAVLRGGNVFVADDLCLLLDGATPTLDATWGAIKATYR